MGDSYSNSNYNSTGYSKTYSDGRNRCKRCNRPISDPTKTYGPYCEWLLGLSSRNSLSDVLPDEAGTGSGKTVLDNTPPVGYTGNVAKTAYSDGLAYTQNSDDVAQKLYDAYTKYLTNLSETDTELYKTLFEKYSSDTPAIEETGNFIYNRDNTSLAFFQEKRKDAEQKIYDENIKHEKWGFIYGQGLGPTKNMQYGTHYVDYNGCELIAVYNALFQLGDRHPLSNIIYNARTTEGVTWGTGAVFGTHPEKIGTLLEGLGHDYRSTKNRNEFNSLLAPGGTYIVSFWTGKTGISPIHTVMFNMVDWNTIKVYNYSNLTSSAKLFYALDNQTALDSYLSENGKPIILYKVE